MGWWMVFSRTRFRSTEDGGVIVQTWLWDKRVRAADVASFKIVHWPWFQAVIAPRILLRRKGGGSRGCMRRMRGCWWRSGRVW